MAVEVVTNDDATTHASGVKWHIDESRTLHVVGDTGNIAAYAVGVWQSVRLIEGRVR